MHGRPHVYGRRRDASSGRCKTPAGLAHQTLIESYTIMTYLRHDCELHVAGGLPWVRGRMVRKTGVAR